MQREGQSPSTHWPIGGNVASASLRAQSGLPRRRSVQQQFETEAHALVRAIESEIIPRLMLNHTLDAANTAPRHTGSTPLPHNAVAELSQLALEQPLPVGLGYLEELLEAGVSAEAIFVDAITPSAREIGQMWTDDLRDFTDVTIALTRLQSMVNELIPRFQSEDDKRPTDRSALLIPCPGEQHSLGVSMITEYFRRAGWLVHAEAPVTLAELKQTVQKNRFDVVGFSASCDRFIDDLTAAIRVTRKASKNRSVGILVGGDLFNRRPDLVSVVGADAMAGDGREAIRRIPALLGLGAILG
jgi:MerR family transcriptional regulator, light-induced transcriptional regulator